MKWDTPTLLWSMSLKPHHFYNMKFLGIFAILSLLSICSYIISDFIKNRPPNNFYGKGEYAKFIWFLDFFRWGILPTLVFIGVFGLWFFYNS